MTPEGVGIVFSEAPEGVVVHLVNPDGTTKMALAEGTRAGVAAVSVLVSDVKDLRPAAFSEIPRLRAPSASAAMRLGIIVTQKELDDELALNALERSVETITPSDIGTMPPA
jgi:hypothetical protein